MGQLFQALACAGNASDKQQRDATEEAPQTLTQSRRSSLIARESPSPIFWTLDGIPADFRILRALRMQFPHMQATPSCVPMTVNPTPMPVLIPCHRHLTFGRQLCSNMGKSERNIYGSEFPRHQLHNRYTRTSLADNTNCGFTATPKQQDRRANNWD